MSLTYNDKRGLVTHSLSSNFPDINLVSTTQNPAFEVGRRIVLPDDRAFRYCKAGGTSLAHRGAINANIIPGDSGDGYEGAAGYATAIGLNILEISDTDTGHTLDHYRGGWIVIFNGSGEFQTSRILKSTASDGTSLKITIGDPLKVALTATGVGVTLYRNPYVNVKAGMSQLQDFESFIVVPMANIASGEYFWGQVSGPTWVTPHGGTWPGSSAALRDVYFHIDGTIDPATIRVVGTLSPQRAGYLLSAGSSGSYGDALIQLQLD